ncbi:MAG: histidine--tRNA ligase [Dehalococcoidia bacterium]
MPFNAPRGTSDILPGDQPLWDHVHRTAERVARQFAYGRIDTPLFETTELFARGVGDETDIVQKEMYSFEDHGGDSITLRPEGTAAVCRAYLEHGMSNLPQPVRLFYNAPMFRYERPQAGRFRQFHQFGIEAIGDPSPQVDVEVIEMGWRFVRELGLSGVTLRINSIGDASDRPRYVKDLKAYYEKHIDSLPKVARDRLERAPLRLLDAKEPECQDLAHDAPKSLDYLSEENARHWEEFLGLLDGLKLVYPDLNYTVDHRLVRGLDYYTRTVFEIEPEDARGQSTLLAGGRYDGLMEKLGGPPTPGIGFAAGLERLILNVQRQEVPVPGPPVLDIVTVHLGEAAQARAAQLAAALRLEGLSVVNAPAGRSMKAQMRYANQASARFALIIGEREIERGVAALKPLDGGEQVEVPLEASAIAAAVSGPASTS